MLIVATDNFPAVPSDIIVGATVAKTTGLFPFSSGQNKSSFIHLVSNGDVETNRNGARLPSLSGDILCRMAAQVE